jgi:hypothetical protein
MIGQVVMVVLGRVHNDGRPAMGLVAVRMHDIGFAVMVCASGVGTRGNGKRRTNTKYRE